MSGPSLRDQLNDLANVRGGEDSITGFISNAAARFGTVISVREDTFLSAIGPSRHFFVEFADRAAALTARSAFSGIDFGEGRIMVLVPKINNP
jgi:hypothetical protein